MLYEILEHYITTKTSRNRKATQIVDFFYTNTEKTFILLVLVWAWACVLDIAAIALYEGLKGNT